MRIVCVRMRCFVAERSSIGACCGTYRIAHVSRVSTSKSVRTQAWVRSLAAVGRCAGCFTKHCARKSFSAGEGPSSGIGIGSSTILYIADIVFRLAECVTPLLHPACDRERTHCEEGSP